MSKVLLIGKDSETTRSILQALADKHCPTECAHGGAEAIRRLRRQSFDVLITDPETTIEEDLALIEEMREIRPGVKTIVLAPHSHAGGGHCGAASPCLRLHRRPV